MKKTKKALALLLAASLTLSVGVQGVKADGAKWSEQETADGWMLVTNEGGKTLGYSKDSGVKLLEVDGFAFKDLDKDGELDVYEDWRESYETRARDLVNQMSGEEIAPYLTHGGWVIQFLIQTKHQLISFRLIVILLPHFSKLAKMKYSSTVLEKCFEYCNEQSKLFLYNVLYNKGVVKSLIFDKFGNYVVQKAIDSAKDEKIKFYLLRLIAPMINDVKKENFGKQMCMKLCSKYPQFQEYIKNFKKGK